jgi:hypothetical protein
MRDVSVLAVRPLSGGVRPWFSAFDADGTRSGYKHEHRSGDRLSKPRRRAGAGPSQATSPATIFSGLTLSGQAPYIYLSRDEGRTDTMQTANILMDGGRTNFVVSADGQRVWVIPGPATAGLWQTPVAADAAAPHLTRLARGSMTARFQPTSCSSGWCPSARTRPAAYAVALARDGMYISTDSGRSWTSHELQRRGRRHRVPGPSVPPTAR